ncbi:Conserved_hypothetical protein [Hexamita inflata]|uniref:Myb-like DNA-binding domain-containing protein n=1 Tax=Hexamita inflata TaxID=28002 RepID=A0AA86ND76_9EUKA|nr:Conserved hypothetical protein [Hexamita inflata]
MSSWTDEERDALIKLTQTCFKNSKIDWDKVSSQMKNRTKQQCKSYYTNIIKSELNIEKRKHHQWNNDEFFLLLTKAIELKNDWARIQQVYFPDFTKKQLQCQFQYLINNYIKKYVQQFNNVIKNPSLILNIKDKEFEGQFCLICTANNILLNFNSQEVLDSFEDINDDHKITDQFQWKTSLKMQENHLQIVQELLGNIDVQQITAIYVNEYKRRIQVSKTVFKYCALIINPIYK